jgi:hypothetical protein
MKIQDWILDRMLTVKCLCLIFIFTQYIGVMALWKDELVEEILMYTDHRQQDDTEAFNTHQEWSPFTQTCVGKIVSSSWGMGRHWLNHPCVGTSQLICDNRSVWKVCNCPEYVSVLHDCRNLDARIIGSWRHVLSIITNCTCFRHCTHSLTIYSMSGAQQWQYNGTSTWYVIPRGEGEYLEWCKQDGALPH